MDQPSHSNSPVESVFVISVIYVMSASVSEAVKVVPTPMPI